MAARLELDVNGAVVIVSVDVQEVPGSTIGKGAAIAPSPPTLRPSWDPEEAARRIRLWILSEASRSPQSKLPELVALLYEISSGLVESYQPKPVTPAAMDAG